MLANRQQMSTYFQTAEWQTRRLLIVDDRLMAAAQFRASDMIRHHYFDHVDLNGKWPNELVRLHGYDLPDFYPDDSNQVESIAQNHADAIEALDALANSSLHHQHLTGTGFWTSHTHFGVGYATDGLRRVYVLITAPCVHGDHHHDFLFLPVISTGLTGPARKEPGEEEDRQNDSFILPPSSFILPTYAHS